MPSQVVQKLPKTGNRNWIGLTINITVFVIFNDVFGILGDICWPVAVWDRRIPRNYEIIRTVAVKFFKSSSFISRCMRRRSWIIRSFVLDICRTAGRPKSHELPVVIGVNDVVIARLEVTFTALLQILQADLAASLTLQLFTKLFISFPWVFWWSFSDIWLENALQI